MLIYKQHKGYYYCYEQYNSTHTIQLDIKTKFYNPHIVCCGNNGAPPVFIIDNNMIYCYHYYKWTEKLIEPNFMADGAISLFDSILCYSFDGTQKIFTAFRFKVGDNGIEKVEEIMIKYVCGYKITERYLILSLNYHAIAFDRCRSHVSLKFPKEFYIPSDVSINDLLWVSDLEKTINLKPVDMIYLKDNYVMVYTNGDHILTSLKINGEILYFHLGCEKFQYILYEQNNNLYGMTLVSNFWIGHIYKHIVTPMLDCISCVPLILNFGLTTNAETYGMFKIKPFLGEADCDFYKSQYNTIIKHWRPCHYGILNEQNKKQVQLLLLYNKYYLNGPYKLPMYIFTNIVNLFII